jgi:hypothetical protein
VRLIKMGKDQFLCTAASFAMALDIPLDTMLADLGHNGMIVAWPDLAIPNCYRGLHPQELFDVARWHGYAVTMIERNPISTNQRGDRFEVGFLPDNDTRLLQHMDGSVGVLIGYNKIKDTVHYCAWDGKMVFDPRGLIYPLDSMNMAGYEVKIFFLFDAITP